MSKRITNKQIQIAIAELRQVQEAASPTSNPYSMDQGSRGGSAREWNGAIDDVVGLLRGIIESRNAQKRRCAQRRRDAMKNEREKGRQGSLQFEPLLLTSQAERIGAHVAEVFRVG